VRILIWHEIVNDSIDGRPVVVTYCPLCNRRWRSTGGSAIDC
jgi:hypothetical protein